MDRLHGLVFWARAAWIQCVTMDVRHFADKQWHWASCNGGRCQLQITGICFSQSNHQWTLRRQVTAYECLDLDR